MRHRKGKQMSWSRGYTGTADEVRKQFAAQRPEIEKLLPEFERNDVAHVEKALDLVLVAVPPDATLSVSVGGHGYRETTGKGAGAMNLSVNYTITGQAGVNG